MSPFQPVNKWSNSSSSSSSSNKTNKQNRNKRKTKPSGWISFWTTSQRIPVGRGPVHRTTGGCFFFYGRVPVPRRLKWFKINGRVGCQKRFLIGFNSLDPTLTVMHRTTTCYLVAPFSVLFFLLFAFCFLLSTCWATIGFCFFLIFLFRSRWMCRRRMILASDFICFCFVFAGSSHRIDYWLAYRQWRQRFFFFQNKKKQKTKIFIDRPLRRDREKRNTTKKSERVEEFPNKKKFE